MRPTLAPGTTVLVDRRARSPSPGDIVLAENPRKRNDLVIKRVSAVGPDGLFLVGDNPSSSTDSRAWGAVSPDRLRGLITCTFP